MKLGFIGLGAMGGAIASGALRKGFISGSDLVFTALNCNGDHPLTQEFGVQQLCENTELVRQVDAVVVAVKPKHIMAVLEEIRPVLGNKLVLSIAGGVPVAALEGSLEPGAAVVRVMPNINALVGASMSALCAGKGTTAEQLQFAQDLFNSVGRAIILDESLFGAFTPLAGCAPAWTYTYVEALAKAGVAAGLTKADAVAAATQMLLGSALMLQDALEQGKHPGQLVDQVCSPGGSTIAGLLAGETAGFSNSVGQMVRGAMAQDAKALN